MPDPGNKRRFGYFCVSILYSSEIICDKCRFTIDYFMDSILVTVIRCYTIEGKINQDILIWLCGNMSGTITRWSFGSSYIGFKWGIDQVL